MSDIDATLLERGNRYGKFSGHAELSQALKRVIASAEGASRLNASQTEALSMICHKIARIVNGDPNFDDSWRDIAGYAQLVVNQLSGRDI